MDGDIGVLLMVWGYRPEVAKPKRVTKVKVVASRFDSWTGYSRGEW
jgi:hypothetical protein